MDVRNYAYANARIKAMEAKLLREQRVRELMQVKTMPEVIALLEETAYKDALVKASTKHSGVDVVLYGLQDDFDATIEKLSGIVPPVSKAAFDAVTADWEAAEVKNAILCKAQGTEVPKGRGRPSSLWKKISKARNLDEAFDILATSVYSPEIMQVEGEFRKTKDFRLLLKAIDNHYYSGLAKLFKIAKDETSIRLLRDKISLANALIIMRMKRDSLTREQIERELIPFPLSKRELELIDAKDLKACVEVMRRHGLPEDVAKECEASCSLSYLELQLQKQFTDKTLRLLRLSVLSFGVVLGYLYLKQTEVDNIKKIALGKAFGIEDEMQKAVYAINK